MRDPSIRIALHDEDPFIVMGVALLVFGIDSVNLLHLITDNARFILENGWMAVVVRGGLWQLLGLLANAYVAMAAYVVLKTCEHALSRLARPRQAWRRRGFLEQRNPALKA